MAIAQPGDIISTSSAFMPRSSVVTTTTASSNSSSGKQHAKISPYITKQELQHQESMQRKHSRSMSNRSPKLEKPGHSSLFDLELSSVAAQGKLAYVSPTVRALPSATAAKLQQHQGSSNAGSSHGGGLSSSSSSSALHQHSHHRNSALGSMRLCVQQGGPNMSQLSPVQLGQPTVLLNTASQVDVHG